MKSFLRHLYRQGVQLMVVSLISGLLVGVVITCYSLAAEYLSEYSHEAYRLVTEHPEFIPLLFVALAIAAFIVGVAKFLVPMISGSGIPQAEGASRGLLKLKWYQVMPAMVATSLFCILAGVEGGVEGPAMLIGACAGDGVGSLFGASDMEKRYQITAGASASLAVVCNAPLTGIIFALEEAHRRFTPSIFICAFFSVVTSLITKSLLFQAMGFEITPIFEGFVFVDASLKTYAFVALSAFLTSLVGVAFFKLTRLLKKLLSKITVLKGSVRMLVPFLLTGVVGMITLYAIGDGHTLMNSLSTGGGAHEMSIGSIFSSPIVVTLVVIVILRFVSTCVNVGSGMPAGAFIPTLAIGACLGALGAKMCGAMGMSSEYSDLIVIISVSTFFAVTVKAPLTAIVLAVELTRQFTPLLPVVLGVSIGYIVSQLLSVRPMYETFMEDLVEEQRKHLKTLSYTVTISEGAPCVDLSIRDVLWPDEVLVTSIKRGDTTVLAHSDSILKAGDEITIEGKAEGEDELKKYVDEIVKPLRHLIKRKDGGAVSVQEYTDRIEDAYAASGLKTGKRAASESDCAKETTDDGPSDLGDNSQNTDSDDKSEKADSDRGACGADAGEADRNEAHASDGNTAHDDGSRNKESKNELPADSGQSDENE